MRIGTLARRLGTTPHALRFYEAQGIMPGANRGHNGYRDYSEADAVRLRLLIGLRQLDLPLRQAAELANLCAEGRCDEVSDELKALIPGKREDLARRMDELRFLDGRLAHLGSGLEGGKQPRTLITNGKEDADADTL